MADEEEVEEADEEAVAAAAAGAAASSAVAAITVIEDDASVALRLHSIDQLNEIFGFPRHLAELAVDAVGNPFDVTLAYNYLLDRASEQDGSRPSGLVVDQGGPVTPIFDCPHVQDRVSLTPSQLPFCPQACRCTYLQDQAKAAAAAAAAGNKQSATAVAPTGQKKAVQDDDGSCPGNENWLCLQCGVVRCGRYSNAHGVAHWKETQAAEEETAVNRGAAAAAGVGHCLAVGLADLSVWCHMCRAYVLNPSLKPLLDQLEAIKFQPEWSSSAPPVLEWLLGPTVVEEKPANVTTVTAASAANVERDSPCSPCTPQKKRARSNPSPSHPTTATATATATASIVNATSGNDPMDVSVPSPLPPSPLQSSRDTNEEVEMVSQPNDPGGGQRRGSGGETEVNAKGADGREAAADDNDGVDDDGMDGDEAPDDDTDDQPESPSSHHGGGGGSSSVASSTHDQDLLDMVRAVAAARGIPFDFLLAQVQSEDDGDDDAAPIEYPFDQLPTSLEDVAQFIASPNCQRILVLAGAGMSVASGIPDFRSADGLYATLDPDLLTASDDERRAMRLDPTAALEQNLFLQNPFPLLELNREFILGTRNQKWKATLAHRIIELLHVKTGKLVRWYTQNIDGLEDQCDAVPCNRVIAVHGSMDRAECASCGTEADMDDFADRVQRRIKDLSRRDPEAPNVSTPIACHVCGKHAVKPAIVLFRSSLPKIFFDMVPGDVRDVDLLLVIGTSLRVAPANSLVWRVPRSALRLLVNREPVGDHLGMESDPAASRRDYFAAGDCDAVLLDLAEHLGWLDELAPLLEHHRLPESSARMLRERLGRTSSSRGAASSSAASTSSSNGSSAG